MVDQVGRHPRVHFLTILVGAACALTLAFAGVAHAGPAPVNLGTADAFAVLAGSGMTNTGESTIVGDVGSSPTSSQTGFGPCPAANCVRLTGTNHDVANPNDAVTQQAKTDLITAYDDAFGRTGGTAITGALGAGMTLVSGVYTSDTDIFVGGDLTLDAGGDPHAVFIFQAKTGTLITAAGITSGIPNTRILLSNGAQACNVFWQVGSSATIATFTQFLGNVLALQSITVNTSATLDTGRVLARNGAVTLQANTIKKATCATATDPGDSPKPEPTPTSSDGGGGGGGGGGSTTTSPTPTPTPAASGGGGSSTTAPGSGFGPSPAAPSAGPSAQALANSVRVRGPRRPVSGPFTVSVTGRRIRSVTFYVDGRRRTTVRAREGRTKFNLRIDPRRQSRRVHTVTVLVRFKSRSGARTTRRVTYRRVSASVLAPRYTG